MHTPIPVQPRAQAGSLTQKPFASHCWGTSLSHCRAMGSQSPLQTPLLQTWAQSAPLTHCPFGPQVSGVLFSQRTSTLGMQTPQIPSPTHRFGQGVPSFWYIPFASQRRGCWPVQAFVPA